MGKGGEIKILAKDFVLVDKSITEKKVNKHLRKT